MKTSLLAMLAVGLALALPAAHASKNKKDKPETESETHTSTGQGVLFSAEPKLRQFLPGDIRKMSKSGVGEICSEDGKFVDRSNARCLDYVSDSTKQRFRIRLHRNSGSRTFILDQEGNPELYVRFAPVAEGKDKVAFVSTRAQQFAAANGGDPTRTAATSPASAPGDTTPAVAQGEDCSKIKNFTERGLCLARTTAIGAAVKR